MKNVFESLELFYFDACPSWKESIKNLKESLNEIRITNEIKLIRIETHEEAVSNQFPGSPTIKVNGKDIFPTRQNNYALGCRVYNTPDGFKGSPSKEMITERLLEIISK